MRKLVAILALGALLALAATALAATKTVRVGDNWFVRDTSTAPTVRVAKGTTVVWRWVGDNPHNVVVTRGPVKFQSPIKRSGTYRRTLRRRGTYTIICSIHGGRDQKMVLKVG